jgi:hypothetical protein
LAAGIAKPSHRNITMLYNTVIYLRLQAFLWPYGQNFDIFIFLIAAESLQAPLTFALPKKYNNVI